VADQQAAKPIVVPLLVDRPDPALGLVELVDQPQTALVGVVAHLLPQQSLVEIESCHIVALFLGEFLQESAHQVA
jgi:hypothetical protein